MLQALAASAGWKLVAKIAGGLVGFFKTPLGQAILFVGIVYGAYQMGEHHGTVKTDTAWNVKWTQHVEADKAYDKLMEEQYNKRVDRLTDNYTKVLEDLHKRLKAAENRPPIVKTVIKEVTKYVTPSADARAVVPAGFVWYHDVAATESPDDAAALAANPPADVDAPSGIALSTVATVTAFNYEECRTRGVMLDLWQQWYVRSKAEYEAFSKPLTEAEQRQFIKDAFEGIDGALKKYSNDRAREEGKPPVYPETPQ